MANKFLDLAGLQRLVNKIKEWIPIKNSELENDSGFITIEDIPGGETQITIRHQERFIVGTSSIFEFTKGYYTLNANSVNWYLDGIKQSNDTLIEIDNRTIEVVGGLPEGSTVVFDYVEYTNTVIGLEGVGVEYQWNGTQLGVKREDEVDYQYQDLEGEKGSKGDKGDIGIQGPRGLQGEQGPKGIQGEVGPKGDKGEQGIPGLDGKSLEFHWNATQLGIRIEGETTYQYVNLKGDKGNQGVQGERGLQGIQGEQGIQGPKGEKGDQGIQGPKGDKGEKGETGEIENLTGGMVTDALGYIPLSEDSLPSNLETTSGSQAKANQAEQNAKNYTDSELASFEEMVEHGNEYHTESYATELDLNAHKVEKATQDEYGHIRLQDIPNPETATQIEAETGTNNTKMMTPLRVKQAIASNVRMSGATVEIYIDNEWVSFERIFDINSWEDVQEIVRNGWANDYFAVGDELVSGYDGREIIWQVIGIDVDTPSDNNFTHSMTIQTKDVIENRVWESSDDNRYINSDIRAYLNNSFLSKLDPELSAVIGQVNKKVAVRNAIGGQDNFSDKVFLLSRKEVDLGDEGTNTGEFIYPFYNGKGNANRIKNLNGRASIWWLRSPLVTTSNYVRHVITGGSTNYNYADMTHGVSPACVII